MLRGIWGDPERYRDTYWSRFPGRYFAGDGAKLDDDGYLWLLGRVDDVMNVSGHRISTTEVESALVDHPAVAEAAVVGATDDITGQAIVAYVILRGDAEPSRRAGRGAAPARRHEDRPDRPPEDGHLRRPTCPRPAPARSCAGCCATSPRAATSATPPRSPTPTVVDEIRDRAAERAEDERAGDAVARVARATGGGATARSTPGPAVVFDMDGVLSDAAGRQHYLDRPFRGLGGLLRGVRRRRRSSTRSPGCSRCSTPTSAIVLLTARPDPGRSPRRSAWLERYDLRWDLLVMRDCGDYGSSRDFKQRVGRRAPRATASTCASPSRTTAATSTCSTPRASPASTSTPATTTDADAPGAVASVAEVVELQGDAEVDLLEAGDHGLEVVALLAGDPDLIALGLRLDALEAEVLDGLVDAPWPSPRRCRR